MRNAQAVYMNQDDPRATPFIRELRKRLFHNIRLFDKYCALDRGSSQLIRSEEFSIPFPANTNDDLFGPESTTIPNLQGNTEMSFSLMAFESCDTIEALLIPEIAPNGPTWEERRKLAIDMGVQLEEKFLKHCDLSKPHCRMQHTIGKSIIAAMVIRAVRPMQRHLSSVPPPVSSPEVLQLAVDNLEAARVIFADNEFEQWKWIKWVPWHALSVALAGLCSIRDTPLSEKAWNVVEVAYPWCAKHIADGEEGMLWRPILKLYKKATAFRDGRPVLSSLAKSQPAVKPSTGLANSTSITPASVDTSLDWSRQWTSTDGATDNVNHLSNDFSSMAPFNLPASSALTRNALLGSTTLPEVDYSSTVFNDASWIDWSQTIAEFNDPLATSDGMDVAMMMDEWNVETNMAQL